VNGTNGADNIQVTAQGGILSVAGLPSLVTIKNAEPTDGLTVDGLGGDDAISAKGLAAGVISLTIDGGDGNDSIDGSGGGDQLLGGDRNDFIIGRKGDDTALLQAGDDVFVWNPGDGNDIVEGQDGTDELLFNGANINENIDISANGQRVRFTRDVANVTMDLNGTERITFNALGGIDKVVVGDLTGTAATDIFVNLSGSRTAPGVGDGKPDVVTVTGTPGNDTITGVIVGNELQLTGLTAVTHVSGSDATGDKVLVNGGGG